MIRYKNYPQRNNTHFYHTHNDRLVIEKPIMLSEVFNLKNYLPIVEFTDFIRLFSDLSNKDNLIELNKRIDLYKNYNIGKSKFFISFFVPEIRRLIGLSYIIKNSNSISFYRSITPFNCPIESKSIRSKDELIIKELLKITINNEDKENVRIRKTMFFYDRVYLYFSYRIGLLDKWLDD